jgi:hypothetical protein
VSQCSGGGGVEGAIIAVAVAAGSLPESIVTSTSFSASHRVQWAGAGKRSEKTVIN